MKISKHVLVVIIAIVIIAGGLAFAFIFLKPDPEKLTIDAISKQTKLDKYKTTYNLSYKTKAGGLNLDASGLITVTKYGDVTKVSMTIDTFGEKIRLDQYQTNNGTIQCMLSLLNTTCQKVSSELSPLKTPQEQVEELKKSIQNKEVTIKYISTKTISGRTCDELKFIPKTTQELSALAGNIDLNMCLDREYGIPLEMFVSFDITGGDGSGSIKIVMSLTDLGFNVEKIEIPEYTEATQEEFGNFTQ